METQELQNAQQALEEATANYLAKLAARNTERDTENTVAPTTGDTYNVSVYDGVGISQKSKDGSL